MSIDSSENKNPRDMTVEETMKWTQDLINSVSDKNKGVCSFDAVKLPVRRKILHALEEKSLDIDELSGMLEIDKMKLKYHLNVLDNACFISIDGDQVDLTPGGIAVVRVDKQREQSSK